MKVKRIAIIAAALSILSVLFYIGSMIHSVGYDIQLSNYYNYFFSDRFKLTLVMSVYSVTASIYITLAAIDTRKLRRALIVMAFYLAVLIISFERISHAGFALSVRLYGYDNPYVLMQNFVVIMTFIPCMLSMILEACACFLIRKRYKGLHRIKRSVT